MKNIEKVVVGSLVALAVVTANGCTTTQKGAGIGTLIGAGTGAIIGHQSGHGAEGALIGEQMDVKYCPACGKSYDKSVEYCQKDGTKLEYKK